MLFTALTLLKRPVLNEFYDVKSVSRGGCKVSKNGQRCGQHISDDDDYCYLHQPESELCIHRDIKGKCKNIKGKDQKYCYKHQEKHNIDEPITFNVYNNPNKPESFVMLTMGGNNKDEENHQEENHNHQEENHNHQEENHNHQEENHNHQEENHNHQDSDNDNLHRHVGDEHTDIDSD
jgi:hypothetical protein